jgi:pyrroline-5-carboxylate reductase
VVRPATTEDARAIASLLAVYVRLKLVRDRPLSEIRRLVGTFLVAEMDGKVAGCVALRVYSPTLAEVASLAVAEGYQGAGIGNRLIQAAVLRAHARGVRRVFAFTMRDHLFRRLGFQIVPVTEFPQKLVTDYGGIALAAGQKRAMLLDLEKWTAWEPALMHAPPSILSMRSTASAGSGTEAGPAEASAEAGRSAPERNGLSGQNSRNAETGAGSLPEHSAEKRSLNRAFSRPLNPKMRQQMSENEGGTGNGRKIAILGGGNLGRALAMGWVESGSCPADHIWITRRNADKLTFFSDAGFRVGSDNVEAVRGSDVIVLAIQPQQIGALADEIREAIDPNRHRIISVASGISIRQLRELLDTRASIVRAMPNTAVSIGQSMTCVASSDMNDPALPEAVELFDVVGRTLVISEDMMIPATALCACGIAFFLRAIRAASQGGIEIGFHPEEALLLAAQTATGSAMLLLNQGRHPESEIDQVTTPRGCTIAGLNEMEHQGFSSAMIKGILLSAAKADTLYKD